MKKQTKKATAKKPAPKDVIPPVIEGEVIPAADFNEVQADKLQRHVTTARHEFAGMVTHFHASVERIGKAVCDAKSLAGQMRVPFASLFGDPSDESKFPFSENWGNKFARVYKSKVLGSDLVKRLPPDVNVLDTIAGVPADKQPAVVEEYEELRKAGKKPQDAAKLAKKKAGGPPSKMARAPKPKKGGGHYFDPSAFSSMDDLARVLVDNLDVDDADVLAGEVAKCVAVERDDKPAPKSKGKRPPKAAPEDSRDVKAEVRALCADMTSLMLSEVLAEVKAIMEERK